MTNSRWFLPIRCAALLLAAGLLLCSPGAAGAQVIKPWAPASDTLLQITSRARVRFEQQKGDSLGGSNYEAYDLVAQAARRLLRALGRNGIRQAPAVEATLDSLGLDTELVQDPDSPTTVFLLIRNPFSVSSDAIGYLFWFKGNDLRMQGASFPPSRDARMRVWWTGRNDSPYEAAVVYRLKKGTGQAGFKLFRMSNDGNYWNLVQYEGHGPQFEPGSDAWFADVNHDGTPELMVFTPATTDSTFQIASGVPRIVNELLYTERTEGFVLHDLHTVPGPVPTLDLFVRLLQEHQYDRAKQLLMKPEKLAEVLPRGWGESRARGAWLVEYAEPSQPWPEWVAVRVLEKSGPVRYIVHFFIRDGRWVIRDWMPVQDRRPPGVTVGGAARDTVRTGRR